MNLVERSIKLPVEMWELADALGGQLGVAGEQFLGALLVQELFKNGMLGASQARETAKAQQASQEAPTVAPGQPQEAQNAPEAPGVQVGAETVSEASVEIVPEDVQGA